MYKYYQEKVLLIRRFIYINFPYIIVHIIKFLVVFYTHKLLYYTYIYIILTHYKTFLLEK